MRKIVLFLFCFVSLTGCSSFNLDWNPFYKPADIAQPVVEVEPKKEMMVQDNPFVDSGQIIYADELSKGGILLIESFRAGPGVESNEQLDQLSLKIIQGIAAELKDYRPYFKIVTYESKEKADFVLKGFFMDLEGSSKLKGWLPGMNQKFLSVKGQIIQRDSGKSVLVFTDSLKNNDQEKEYSSMSYALGQDIGRFIRSGVSE